jgi:hypothetical protein
MLVTVGSHSDMMGLSTGKDRLKLVSQDSEESTTEASTKVT